MPRRIRAFILASFLCAAVAGAQGLTVDQAQLVEQARAVALNYSRWLPDLICTERIQRSADWDNSGRWTAIDTLTAQVTYFQRAESYKLTARNGHPTNNRLENVAGATSQGEFGSMLRWIFDPDANAAFEGRSHQTIRSTPTSVFAYRVEQSNSKLELRALSRSVITGFHGEVFIDDATGLVLRLTEEAEGPKDFPIRDSYVEIDYDWMTIDGHRYLVPVRAETRITEAPHADPMSAVARDRTVPPVSCVSCEPPPRRDSRLRGVPIRYRNRMEFRAYRKFTAESKVTY